MYEYLLSAGFQEIFINKRQYGSYLYYKFDDTHSVVYIMKNGIKYFMKKFYEISMKSFPDEMIIINYQNNTTIKIIDKINTSRKLKEVPYKKAEYNLLFQHFDNIEYAVVLPEVSKHNDQNMKAIIESYDICCFVNNNSYQENLDVWLDKN